MNILFDHYAILEWCMDDVRHSTSIKIHNEFTEKNCVFLRKKIHLTELDIKTIRRKGLIEVREDLESCIHSPNSKFPSDREYLKYILVGVGACCRACMKKKYKIGEWEEITSVIVNFLISKSIQWIQSEMERDPDENPTAIIKFDRRLDDLLRI